MSITGKDLLEKSKQVYLRDKKVTSGADLLERYNTFKNYYTTDITGVDQKYIDSFVSEANNFLGSGNYDNSSYSTWKQLGTKADAINAWLLKNKSNLSKETYNSIANAVDTFSSATKDFAQFNTEDDYIKNRIGWLDPDAEVNAEMAAERREKYQGNANRITEIEEGLPWYANTWIPNFVEDLFLSEENEGLRDEAESLKAENTRYEHIHKAEDDHFIPITDEVTQIASNRDFSNASMEDLNAYDASIMYFGDNFRGGVNYIDDDGNIVNSYTGEVVRPADEISKAMLNNDTEGFYNSVIQDKLGMFLSASEEDFEEAYNRLSASHGNSMDTWANTLRDGDVNGWKQLTEDEITIYYYKLNTEGQEAAYKFLDDMTTELTRRETQKRADEISEAPLLEQIAWNVASVPMNVIGGAIAFGADAIDTIRGGEINPYSRAHSWQNDASVIRATTAEDLDNLTGNVSIPWLDFGAGDAYQALMSGADSLVGAYTLGGTGYGAFMGMGAASSTAKDLYERGASKGQIAIGSLAAGIAEGIFEKYSIDEFVKMGDTKSKRDFIINILKQGGVEASEEAFTEIANTITDALVMGSQAEVQDVGTFVKNVTNAALGGFISGGAMGAVGSGADYVNYAQQRTEHGQDIINDGGVDTLRQLALDMAGVSQKGDSKNLTKLAGKVESKASAKNVGKLSAKMENTIVKQNQADIQKALVEKGLSEKDAKRVAEYLGSTEARTKEQRAEVKGNENIKAVVKELLENPKSEISERGRNLLAARLGIDVKNSKVNASNSGELSLKNDVDVKERVSETGKTTLASTGEEITIDKSNPIAKVDYIRDTDSNVVDRVVYYNTDHGTVKASNVKYASETEGLLYEAFADMNPAFANAVIRNYDNSTPIQTYINGMREGMILYGMHNFRAVGDDISKNTFLAELSEADQAFALKLGKAYAKADAKKASKDLRSAIKKAAEKAKEAEEGSASEGTQNKPKKSKVSFEEGVKAGKQHKRVVALAKHLSSIIGINIVFYDANTTRFEAGKKANGFYDADTDTIYLDLQNAHDDAKTIAYTLSHELVHFIKKWSPQKFNTFAEFLMEQYASHGVSAANLLKRKMVELKTTDADYAYEEMIADACETMLLDSNAMVKLMELRKSDLELFEKIKLHIYKILNDIREAYKSLGYQPTSDEAKALLGMKDVLEKFYSMFEEAAVDATKNYQALGTEGYNEFVAKRTLNTDSVSVSENGTVKLQMKQYQQTGRSTLLNYLTEQYGKDNAYDLIATIDNIYDTLAEIKNDEALSVFSNWQDTEIELDEDGHPIFTTSINNGDYELNQDFSRVCKKRRQLDFVLNMLAEDPAFEASNLTKSDFVKINKAIKNHGFEIACALCFVDSKRFRQAEWADSFANTWNDILNSVVKDSSKLTPFNFATKNPNIADDGIEIDTSKAVMYRKWSEGKEDVKNRREYESFEQMLSKADDGKWLEGNTNVRTIATLIRDNPNLRHTFRGADIIASQGFDTIQRLAPGIRSILDGWGGSSVPKPSSNDASYDSSIINLSSYNKETAYAMGGARMNSFSDFMAHMFFDYCQAFADLSAKELPSQAYTKELIYVRLFGRSGQKINMSGIAAIREDALPTTASKNVSKAQAEANEKIEKMIAGLDVTRLLEHLHKDIMQLTEADVEQFLDMCDYVWADESINMKHATLLQTGILYDKLSESKVEECYELLKAGEIEQALNVAGEENVDMVYAKHCGTIVVGVSDAHIRKLLRDPTVRMVIPYHKSGLNPVIARELRISAYNDYTLTQTTGVKRKGTKTAEKIGSKAIKDAYGLKDFSFYDWFGKTIDGKLYDGKATADKYLEWCEKGYYDEKVGDYVYYTTKGDGYILAKEFHKKASIVPKFDAFMGEENYYKVLEDFDCYDTISGEHSAQGAVDFFRSGLPSDYKTVLVDALKEEQKVHDDFRDHLDNKGLKDEVMEIVKARGYTPSIKKQAKKTQGNIYDYSKSFAEQIDDYKKGLIPQNDTLLVSGTPEVWKKVGFNALPVTINQTHVDYALNGTKDSDHHIGETLLKDLPNAIQTPIAIIQSQSPTSNDRAVVILKMTHAGKNVIAAVEVDGYGRTNNIRIDSNAMASLFAKTNALTQLNNAINNTVNGGVELFYWNKKEAVSLLQRAGLQLSSGLPQDGFVHSIHDNGSNVKTKFENVVETQQFKRWFGDWQKNPKKASKIVNDDGTPMVVYHGTNEDFSIFDTNRTSRTTKRYADGFYFTAEKKVAEKWGKFRAKEKGGTPIVMECFLDVKNPLIMTAKEYQRLGFDDKYRDSVLQKLIANKNDGIIIYPEEERIPGVFADSYNYDAGDSVYYNADKYGITDKDYAWWLNRAVENPDFTAMQVAVFSPEQIKSATDNIGTFDSNNPNIRYQKKKGSDRTILANALETTAQNDIEKNKLAQYKEKIALIESEQEKLADLRAKIKELSFAKGARDTEAIKKLQFEANQTANRINTYDRQLLNLESTTALKGVLEREKQLAYQKAKKEGKEALDAYREKMTKTQRELLTRYKDQRKEQREKATERRDKTTLRRKIHKIVKELNSLLKKGNKKKNIKQEMQDTVASSLALAEVLFNDDIKNEDIVRLGVASVTTKESEYLNKYRDLLDERDSHQAKIESIYASGDVREIMLERVAKVTEELDKVNGRIAYLNNKLSDLFERERARLNKATIDSILDELVTEYSKLEKSENGYIKNAYNQAMKERLESLKESFEGKIAKDMDVYQLSELYDTFKAIAHMIRNANNLFRDGKTEDLMTNVSNMQSEIYEASTEQKDRNVVADTIAKTLNEFSWNNLRPVDAVERLGSQTFEKLFWDFVHGMGVAARDIAEAGEVIASAREKFGYSKWNMELADTSFTTRDGMTFKPSLADKLSIYAYSKRTDKFGRNQAEEHMVEGGFTYDTGETYKETEKGVTYVRRKLSNTYRLSKENIQAIIDSLTNEQRAYVDTILPYLTDMGKKGNEVSMIQYGIELFGESVYFPLQSSRDYLSSTTQTLGATPTMSSLANSGFTKQTKPHANNPIVLRGFDDVVLEHIEKMSNYHGLVIPIENLRRVFDNVGKATEGMPIATKALIGSRFGVEAQKYFEQWLTDINGGVMPSGAKNLLGKLFSRAKGMSVAANLSVVAQQYFSIIRAMELVDPKYFAPFLNGEAKKTDMKQYEELIKYAPIAIIKEMGGFDVGSSGRAKDYIGYEGARKDAKYVNKKIDDLSMWGAGKMDELGWVTIWKAIKAEVASKQKLTPGTEEFFEACRIRFTEVVTKTQVFDSVASRSGYMRSQHDAVKYATSFMGEPTAIVGRYFVAGINFVRAYKSGNKDKIKSAWGRLGRTASVIVVSQILGNLAKSLVYAGRDDDEDEALLEKWSSSFAEALMDDLNVLNSLPFGRDIVSVIEGWDVERPDMTLIADMVKSSKKMLDGEVTLNDSLGLIGTIGNFFGKPLKNIIREIKSAINVFGDITDDIQPTDIGGAFVEGITGDERSKAEMLYDAVERGDIGRVNAIKATYEDEDSANAAIRKYIGEAYKSGEMSYSEAMNALEDYGDYDSNDAYWKLREWDFDIKYGEDAEYSKYTDFYEAVRTGKNLKAVIKEYTDNGVEPKILATQITNYYKPLYKEMSNSERANIKGYLLNAYALLGYNRTEKSKDIDNWLKD